MKLSIVENIQLPPTLLSRFDLIYLLLDAEKADSDEHLAKHLVSLYENPTTRGDPSEAIPYSAAQVAEYISYARSNVNPIISDDARAVIVTGYVEMRKMGIKGGSGKKTITATTRQLESIVRLSEAHARMRLSRTVDPQDVTEALRLIRVATQTAAIDPRTGMIDMNRLTTGHATDEGDIVASLAGLLRERLASRGRGETVTISSIMKDLAMLQANAASMGGGGGFGGGGGYDEDGSYGYGSGSGGAEGGAGAAFNLAAVSAEEIMEALRILDAEEQPVIRLAAGSKVTIVA